MIQTMKCILVGDEGVGKTSLLKAYLYPQNELQKAYSPTLGAEKFTAKVLHRGQDTDVEYWDIGRLFDHYSLLLLPYFALHSRFLPSPCPRSHLHTRTLLTSYSHTPTSTFATSSHAYRVTHVHLMHAHRSSNNRPYEVL